MIASMTEVPVDMNPWLWIFSKMMAARELLTDILMDFSLSTDEAKRPSYSS